MIDLKQAYKMVFNDLLNYPMFRGNYDTVNGNRHFMYGIETVMEAIAEHGYDDDFADNFSRDFTKNMVRSIYGYREEQA